MAMKKLKKIVVLNYATNIILTLIVFIVLKPVIYTVDAKNKINM